MSCTAFLTKKKPSLLNIFLYVALCMKVPLQYGKQKVIIFESQANTWHQVLFIRQHESVSSSLVSTEALVITGTF